MHPTRKSKSNSNSKNAAKEKSKCKSKDKNLDNPSRLIEDPGEDEPHSTSQSCDPEEAMKIFFGIIAVLAVVASLIADYKWRQWMANHHPTDEDLSVGTPSARRRKRP
jgi:hypothetical protein